MYVSTSSSSRDNLLRAIRFECPNYIPMTFHINAACWNHYDQNALLDLMEEHPFLFPDFQRPEVPFIPEYDDVARAGQPYVDDFGCRWETVMNGIRHIEKTGNLTDETIIVTHDCVRPLVTKRIICENIEGGQKYTACNTVVPATDTIMVSKNGETICEVPDRAYLYQSQTPQTFKAKALKECYERLTEEEKERLTDACKIMVLSGIPVHMIQGDAKNIKITYAQDLKVAETLLERQDA